MHARRCRPKSVGTSAHGLVFGLVAMAPPPVPAAGRGAAAAGRGGHTGARTLHVQQHAPPHPRLLRRHASRNRLCSGLPAVRCVRL